MSNKIKKITVITLVAIIAIIFLGSAAGKVFGSEQMVKMAAGFGFSTVSFKVLGIIEILAVVSFIFPRTGVFGTVLLAAYMGGGIATHLQHGQPIMVPVIIECLIFVTAAVRFPELIERLFKGEVKTV